MADLITRENLSSPKIEEGDAGIIIKADGTFRLFNTIPPADLVSPTPAHIECGRKLIAAAAVIQDKEIRDLILEQVGALGSTLNLKLDS